MRTRTRIPATLSPPSPRRTTSNTAAPQSSMTGITMNEAKRTSRNVDVANGVMGQLLRLTREWCGRVSIRSHTEQLGLLDGELLVRQHALLLERGQILQLGDRVRGDGRRLLRVAPARLLVALLLPAGCLAARDAVAHRRRGARDDGR